MKSKEKYMSHPPPSMNFHFSKSLGHRSKSVMSMLISCITLCHLPLFMTL